MSIRHWIAAPAAMAVTIMASAVPQADVDKLRFNAVQEKKNTTVNVHAGAVGGIGIPGGANGLSGTTADFQGQKLPVWVLFGPSVTEEELEGLLDRQGRIGGTVRCGLVRVGNSPNFPQIKMGVLAQDCVIKTLQ